MMKTSKMHGEELLKYPQSSPNPASLRHRWLHNMLCFELRRLYDYCGPRISLKKIDQIPLFLFPFKPYFTVRISVNKVNVLLIKF